MNSDEKTQMDSKLNQLVSRIQDFQHIKRMLEFYDDPEFPMVIGYTFGDRMKWSWVNNRFAKELQRTKEEIYAVNWSQFIEPNSLQRVMESYERKEIEKRVQYMNYTIDYVRKDGTVFTITWFTSVMDVKNDETSFCVGLLNLSTF